MNVGLKIGKLFRVDEWYDSKVPLLVIPFLNSLVMYNVNTNDAIIKTVALIVFYSLFLGYGYLINDFADIEVDQKAGKMKVIHRLPKPAAVFLLFISVFCGCLPILAFSRSKATLITLFVIYFFGGSYSMPPLRFKERGVWGLIVSSSAQRCFPLLAAIFAFDVSADRYYIVWIASGFVVGLRYILVHQHIDMENDIKSGVNTFAVENGKKIKALIIISFVFEMFLNFYLILPLVLRYKAVAAVLACYFCIFAIRWQGSKAFFGHGGLFSFEQMPLEDWYNNYLPVIYMSILCKNNIIWGVVLAIWIGIMMHSFLKRMEFPLKYFADRISMRKGDNQ